MTEGSIANGVILADNDGQMRGIVRTLLLRAGQQVFPTADGLEAVMIARRFQARLVLLDIAMPRLNGLQACEAIKALPGYAGVPIVMLTGNDDERLRTAAKRLGADDFITKPFSPFGLLERLALYLDIPDDVLPARAPASGGTQPEARMRVWGPVRPAKPAAGENSQLASGRDVMRVYRNINRW